MPRSLSSRIVRARFVTTMYGTDSAAPEATLIAAVVRPQLRSFGAMTACAPAPSATRRHAPRLCGSCTPSSTSSNGDDANVQALRELAQLLRARVLALRVDVDLADRLRPLPQAARDRVEAGEVLHLRRFFVARGSPAAERASRGSAVHSGIPAFAAMTFVTSVKSIFACSMSTRTTFTRTRPPSW